MALGPGKYDDLLTVAREAARAREPNILGAVLIVVAPPGNGSGFSCQLTMDGMRGLPALLRFMADGIEADLATGAAFMPGRGES